MASNSNNIEALLDKYFNSETSLQEETVLKEYFAQTNVPEHLKQYQAMFAYFAQNKKEKAPQNIQVKPSKKSWNFNWLHKVAVVLLLLAIGYAIYPKGISDTEKKEVQSAFIETQKALKLISMNLNKGSVAVAYLDEFEISKGKIFKK